MAFAAPVSYPGAPPQETEAVGMIVNRIELWELGIGKDFRLKCEELYAQYRGFKTWEASWRHANGENDRDGVIHEGKERWGAKLHIPLSFRTIETVVPRAIANPPKLLYYPRREEFAENARAVQMLVDSQQEQISIDLPFQDTMRAGMMYGLGVGKHFWDKKVRMRRVQQERRLPKLIGKQDYTLGKREPYTVFDDPRYENIDPLSFMWDPYGYDVQSCGWMAQSIWLTIDGILERLGSGAWTSVTAQSLDEDAIRKLPGENRRYDEIWQRRMRESGFNTTSFSERGEQIHELVEYHDGDQVYCVLDRQILVDSGENPCGEQPFSVYRPTPLDHQMVGIGALEPVSHLNREIDTLRSQRRDLVSLSLSSPMAFDDTAVDPDEISWGPRALIPVDGNPNNALQVLAPRDVPGAGYQEEQSVLANFESVTGLADALGSGNQGTSTATEAQQVQAMVGLRIALGAHRFELEIVLPTARGFLTLDQRKIKEERTLTLPDNAHPEEEAPDPASARYRWVKLGPAELAGEYEIRAVADSMAARNVPQDRADAQQLFNTLAHDWFTDPTKVRLKYYELMGIKEPHAMLRAQQPIVPLAALRIAVQMGADPAILARAVAKAREIEAPEQQGAEQVAPMSSEGAPQQ